MVLKVDYCRTLNINRMIETGAIKHGTCKSGSWVWTDSETGKEKASIGYESNTLDEANPYLRLRYILTDRGKNIDYKIPLTFTRAQYGGQRVWFICPVKLIRTAKLYLPYGSDLFASRQAYGLKYKSQSETPSDRALRKKWKIVHKTDGYDFPVKPKGMHEKTFERILDEFYRQDEICMGYMAAFVQKRWGLLKDFIG